MFCDYGKLQHFSKCMLTYLHPDNIFMKNKMPIPYSSISTISLYNLNFSKKNSWEEIGPPIGMFSTYTTSSKHAKRGVYLLTGISIFEKKYYAVVLSIVIQME